MPHIRTDDGVRIYYEEHGKGSPLVLCYGIGGNTDMWDRNTPKLAERHRVILWEPRGHVRSDSPPDPTLYSFDRWVFDLRDLVNALGLERTHVGGHSLGGGIATRFAIYHPNRVRALVVTDSSSAAGGTMSVDELLMWAHSLEVVTKQGITAVAEYQLEHNPNLKALMQMSPHLRGEIMGRFARLEAIGFANSLRALIGTVGHHAQLSKLDMPVLLIAGDRDPSRKPLETMHRAVAGSKLVVLSPATHFANREQPEEWNREVLAFLEAADRST